MREKIEKMLAELETRLKIANNELEICPEGTLSFVKRKGRATFFQIIYFGGKRLRKSINKMPEVIRGLARKEHKSPEDCFRFAENCVETFEGDSTTVFFPRARE